MYVIYLFEYEYVLTETENHLWKFEISLELESPHV